MEDHPYYDTPDEGKDHHEESVSHQDDAADAIHEELAWEDHPYYDTSGEGEDSHAVAESVGDEEDDVLEDPSSFTTDEEEDLAWEDSPFY